MPEAPPHACAGCKAATTNKGRCDSCRKENHRIIDSRRGSAWSRGYDTEWTTVRLAYLSDHPICEQCESFGHVANADVVDHIVSIEDDPSRRLDPTNFRALCKSHHDARTMRDQVKRRRV